MPNSLRPEDRKKFLRWLDHGVELAQRRLGGKATHRNVIWMLVTDALDMLDRVPDQEMSWLSSGTRSGGWNAVGLTRADLIEIERLRVLSAMQPFDGEARYAPQKDDVERAVGVLEWLRWCSKGDDHRLQKAVVALSRGAEEAAARIYRNGSARVRQSSYEIRTKSVGMILRGLREQAGIVPAPDGVTFMEMEHGT